MNHSFHPQALLEYSEAVQYYSEISHLLATSFTAHVETGITQILLHPKAWQTIEEDIRRYLVQRFPFGIYYTVEDDNSILIQAVLHLSRHPDHWKTRIIKS